MNEIVIFDWGGVLIRGFWNVYTDLSERFNVPIEKVRDAFYSKEHMKGKISYEEWMTHIRDTVSPESDLNEFNTLVGQKILEHLRLDEDVFAILNRIKEEKSIVVALSNTSEIIVWAIRKKFPGLYFSFLRLYLSHELGYLKPQPEIYWAVIKDLAVSPSQLIFIDDKEENIKAAEAQAIRGILYKDPKQLEKALFK